MKTKTTFQEINERLDEIKGTQIDSNCTLGTREEIANKMVSYINEVFPSQSSDDNLDDVQRLKDKGLYRIPDISSEDIADITKYLSRPEILVWDAHVPAHGLPLHPLNNAQFNAFRPQDLLACPHILNIAMNPMLLNIVEQYLGCVPTLYSVNSWWGRPGPPAGPQDFHRDMDDFNFLTLLVYFSDVDHLSGPHCYIECTHTLSAMTKALKEIGLTENDNDSIESSLFPPDIKQGYGKTALYQKLFKEHIKPLMGKAGIGYLIDTFGIHCGIPIQEKPRLVLWCRYGLHHCYPAKNQMPSPFSPEVVHKDCTVDFSNEKNKYIARVLLK